MSDADRKALKVKAGVVKRLAKELEMYEQEVQAELSKVQQLRDTSADPHDIKYAENILAESSAMLPDTRLRLEKAWRELQGLTEELGSSLVGSEELSLAEEQVAVVQPLLRGGQIA